MVSVADGDTITILDASQKQTKIRLYGIDCPETRQPFGTKAKEFTSKAVFGKTVSVTVKDTDRYGRTVGIVWTERKTLNQSIVKVGLAWWYQYYAKDAKDLQLAEIYAKKAKLGVWSQPNPIAPWDWRRGKRPVGQSPEASKRATITGYWLTASSNKRHNSTCRYYQKTNGKAGSKTDGVACKICGG